jgi:hypothetical protein
VAALFGEGIVTPAGRATALASVLHAARHVAPATHRALPVLPTEHAHVYALKSTDERTAVAVRTKTNTHKRALSRAPRSELGARGRCMLPAARSRVVARGVL